jgi:predicted dehydrogenase
MKRHIVGVIMNGVTGRMGRNQHLVRSILAIREQGGVAVGEGETIWPEPVLVGRNEDRLRALSQAHGGLPYTTDLMTLLADKAYPVYFDAQVTSRRAAALRRAIDAGKHVYCEKPCAERSADALELYRLAKAKGVKNGVVQDKLWLPGFLKLRRLIDVGFFGQILSVRGEFGYWVFTGEHQPAQRPSWNYRKAEGGGIIMDMLCHWRYLVDNLFGNVTAISCLGGHHISRRWDEHGRPYNADAEDAAYATFVTGQGIVCQFNSSWCVRVRRDDLLTLQVDGTDGSAVAGLRKCWAQHAGHTPAPVWDPDVDSPLDYYAGWAEVPSLGSYDNAFKTQWELFLRHVLCDAPFPWDLKEGAKGVQLAELGLQSWESRRWLDVPPLD